MSLLTEIQAIYMETYTSTENQVLIGPLATVGASETGGRKARIRPNQKMYSFPVTLLDVSSSVSRKKILKKKKKLFNIQEQLGYKSLNTFLAQESHNIFWVWGFSHRSVTLLEKAIFLLGLAKMYMSCKGNY